MNSYDKPTASIILPAYNSADFILQTIESVIAQDFVSWELIIVNDGSKDCTDSLVRGRDKRIIVINQKNSGIAAARNTGIKHARGDFIAFLDHDDFWHPSKLSSQISIMMTHKEAGVVFSEFSAWNPHTPPEFKDRLIDTSNLDESLSGNIYHKLLLTNWVLFSTAMFRRNVFERVGLFDITLPPADDWDMALRASWEFSFIKLKQVLVLYRQHPKQTSRRPSHKNHETELRDKFISLYGYSGPDHQAVDLTELENRQFRAHYNHGAMHYLSGSHIIARSSFLKALRIKPYSPILLVKYLYTWIPFIRPQKDG